MIDAMTATAGVLSAASSAAMNSFDGAGFEPIR